MLNSPGLAKAPPEKNTMATNGMPDIIQRAQMGDHEAFRQIYEQIKPQRSITMKNSIYFVALTLLFSSYAHSQNRNATDTRLVGGPCEGCEAIFEYGDRKLSPVDTLPDFDESGPKLKVTGTVYQKDGKTPAKGVILYVYHTDQSGRYATRGGETGWARRHGYIRGWMKTGEDGKYTFYTLKPGRYPGRSIPAHIHPTILEPDGKYYWLGSFHFEGDPFLTEKEMSPESPRGGSSGLLSLRKEGNLWVGKRDFILGRNVPGYESTTRNK